MANALEKWKNNIVSDVAKAMLKTKERNVNDYKI